MSHRLTMIERIIGVLHADELRRVLEEADLHRATPINLRGATQLRAKAWLNFDNLALVNAVRRLMIEKLQGPTL